MSGTEAEATTQTPEQQAPGPNAERGSEAEALNALMEREKTPSQPEATETPADEPEAERDEEPAQGETDEPEESGELVEVEYGGHKLKLPADAAAELEKGVLRQADYSRKMNEVGEVEKTAKAQAELAAHLVQGAEKFASVLAEVNNIDSHLKRFEKVDWGTLKQTDPTAFAATAAEFQMLRMNREDAVKRAQAVDSEIRANQAKDVESKRELMFQTLPKLIKGWGDEAGMNVTRFAMDRIGYSLDEMKATTDARFVQVLDMARKFAAIQDGKAALKDKVKELPPVNKPGAPRQANPATEALARFKKTRSENDGIAALRAKFRN